MPASKCYQRDGHIAAPHDILFTGRNSKLERHAALWSVWRRSAEARKYSFPFSCCNRHSERPCISVDVNDNEKTHFQYNANTDVTVYRVGCNRGVTRQLREVVFAKILLYGWIVFVLEASKRRFLARDVIYTSRAYATMSVSVLSLIHI